MSHASLCVLSYERAGFLAEGLASLVDNAEAPFELIIHDDGSTDPAVAGILDGLWRDRATIITNPPAHNQGQGVALNRMFAIASGDPIIKLDQDLLFEPGWLRRVNEILGMNEQAARVHAEPRIGLLGLLHYHHDPVDSAKCRTAQHDGWQEHTHILGSGFAVPRDCWQALGPFEEHSDAFAEDWAFQQAVTASEDYVCALPDDDLVVNRGMGIGPSTIVLAPNEVKTIHHGPLVVNG